jgi:glutamate-1-semialdehyde 2,1-aminomutase
VLVVGSAQTPAAAFVLRHGIGQVVPYQPAALRAAAAALRQPAAQATLRARAAALAPGLSDAGVGDWLRGSVEDGRPRDDRFERLFPRDAPPPEAR